jgi:ABC-type transport system involved in multi-copper enzyme maturation permease subunit
MTFLPIIERELRVRARGQAVYWTRFAVVFVGILIWLPQLIWSGPFGAPATMGRSLFNGLVSAAFLLSCGGCLLTADVISSERREGTLGLLLLTQVRTFDVLLGKLGSAGLTSLCALVACLPMLMISILAGGVTGGEVFRNGLVLPDTLFLALAAGLWASARGQEWLKTARTALLLLAALLLVPGLVGRIFGPIGAGVGSLGLLSPLGTIFAAGDASYKGAPADYWISLLLVQAVGWALVAGAGFRLRSGWREERGESTVPVPGPAGAGTGEPDGPWLSCSWTPPVPEGAAGGKTEMAPPLSRPLDEDANPIAWLLQRQRGIQALLWAGALIGLPLNNLFPVVFRFLGTGLYSSVAWPLGLATTALEGAMFAWAASRFFVEARRTGEIELLLTTPFGAREIVSTQWGVLKRRLRWPMLVMLVPVLLSAAINIAAMPTSSSFGPGYSFRLYYAIRSLGILVDIFVGVGALCWVGLWFGLKAGGQARAIIWTISLVKGVPFLISILLSVLARLAVSRSPLPFWVMLWLPQVATPVFYLGMIRLARRRLLGELTGAGPMKFDLRQSISSAARDAVAAFRKARHWTPS